MPRAPGPPMWVQSSFPVAASRATMDPAFDTYIRLSTTIGLNVRAPPPIVYVQATASCLTFDLLICFKEEYCEESCPPPYPIHVSNDRRSAANRAVETISIAKTHLRMGHPPEAAWT